MRVGITCDSKILLKNPNTICSMEDKSVKFKSCLIYHNDIIKIQCVKIDSRYQKADNKKGGAE